MARNRRIVVEPNPGWELAKGIAIFLVALALAALVSVDDVETVRFPVEVLK
jgi:hypothetical protein